MPTFITIDRLSKFKYSKMRDRYWNTRIVKMYKTFNHNDINISHQNIFK